MQSGIDEASAPRLTSSVIRADIFAGVTVGVVALPLALAFGEASGAGPIAGLWGAIILGFFAAAFGGTPAQISGPTGPMVVVFGGLFASLSGDITLIFAAVVLAGLLQILLGVLRLGSYIRLVPFPVVSGFMSGIGVIIVLLQVSRLFGGAPERSGTIGAIEAIIPAVSNANTSAVILSVITLAIVFLWPKQWARVVPGALTALVVGTVLGHFVFTEAPNLGDIPVGIPDFAIPSISGDTLVVVLEAAIVLAVLGAIDSLLTSLVADNITRARHDSNRVLIGQGVGNAVAGLFGAIPGAGATLRTVVNIRSGGTTRLSGIVHSLLLLMVVLVLGPVAGVIPHAVLAGILVKAGSDIVDIAYLKRAPFGPRVDFAVVVLVLSVTVFVDLITAVAAGVVLAALAFVKQAADKQLDGFDVTKTIDDPAEVVLLDSADGAISVFEFNGPLSFGAATDLAHRAEDQLSRTLDTLDDRPKFMILDFTGAPLLDATVARTISSITSFALESGITIFSVGVGEAAGKVLKTVDGLDQRYDTRVEALSEAVRILDRSVENL